MSTITDFGKWLKSAKHGERYTYYSGGYLAETQIGWEIKKTAWEAACMGRIMLFQIRSAKFMFDFIALRVVNLHKKFIPYYDNNDNIKPKIPIKKRWEVSRHSYLSREDLADKRAYKGELAWRVKQAAQQS